MNIGYEEELQHAIFIDLDGTLCVTGTEPSFLTREAVRKARRAGNKVFLCTGRAPSVVPQKIRDMKWDGMILGLGAYIETEGQIRKSLPYSYTEILDLGRYLDSLGIVYMLEGRESVFMDLVKYVRLGIEKQKGINQEMEDLKEMVARHAITDISQYRGESIYNIVLLSAVDNRLQLVREKLSGKYRIAVHPAVGDNVITDVEVIRKDVNKGEALKFVCEQYKIPLSQSVAFGDSMNDHDMIVTAGLGVVMGNGDDEIKACADMVCGTVEEDGLYYSFEQLGLL